MESTVVISDTKHQEPVSFHLPLVSSIKSIDSVSSLSTQSQEVLKSFLTLIYPEGDVAAILDSFDEKKEEIISKATHAELNLTDVENKWREFKELETDQHVIGILDWMEMELWKEFGFGHERRDNYEFKAIHDIELKIKETFSIHCGERVVIEYLTDPMKEMYDILTEITGYQMDTTMDKEFRYSFYIMEMLKNFSTSLAHTLNYDQMKRIKKFLDFFPKLGSMETTNYVVQMTYIKLKTVFRCRLYRELYGREARLKRYTGWESLIFRKTEKECTGENFKKWMEDTYKLVANYSGKVLLTGLMISNYSFDHQYFLESDVRLIINALSIFISKIDKEEGELFYNFEGFAFVSERDDLSLTNTFSNNLNEFRLEQLNLEDCLKIQELFDKFYLYDFQYGVVSKNVFDFIDNMVQMRIALEKYGDKTGFKVTK